MKINKIREMSSPELEKELGELKSELFKLRFSLATNGLENPMKIKEVKKDIARINTILRQRELEEAKNDVERQQNTNDSLRTEIYELASLDKIQLVAQEDGLQYNNENIIVVKDN